MSDSTREEIEAAATFVQEWRADDDQLRIPTTDWGWELAKAIDVLTEVALASRPAPAETVEPLSNQEMGEFIGGLAEFLAVPAPVGEGEREELARLLHRTDQFSDRSWKGMSGVENLYYYTKADTLLAAGYRKVVS